MAQALGNKRFAALIGALDGAPPPRAMQRTGSATLARHLAAPVQAKLGAEGDITVGAVRAFKTAVGTGWAAMMNDPAQLDLVDVNEVQDFVTAANEAFGLLEAAAKVVNAANPDAATVTKNDAFKKLGTLGPHVHKLRGRPASWATWPRRSWPPKGTTRAWRSSARSCAK